MQKGEMAMEIEREAGQGTVTATEKGSRNRDRDKEGPPVVQPRARDGTLARSTQRNSRSV
jgi:hypothetical protein